MNFTEKQLQATKQFLTTLTPKETMGERLRLEECLIMYNSDMPDCIIVKHRMMGYRDGHDIDELRFTCIDQEGNHKDVRSVITDPNARWSFYHHCKEVYFDGGRLRAKK